MRQHPLDHRLIRRVQGVDRQIVQVAMPVHKGHSAGPFPQPRPFRPGLFWGMVEREFGNEIALCRP